MQVTIHDYIETQFKSVSDFSFEQKKQVADAETVINDFLDNVLSVKADIDSLAEKTESVVEAIEGLTWFNTTDENVLQELNNLISSCRDLRASLIRRYVNFNNGLRKNGIAVTELNRLKTAADDLKEACADVESAFFFLPRLPEFKETTKLLSLV